MIVDKWIDFGAGVYLYNYGDGDVSIKTKETGNYEIFLSDVQIETIIKVLQEVQKLKVS